MEKQQHFFPPVIFCLFIPILSIYILFKFPFHVRHLLELMHILCVSNKGFTLRKH